MIKQTAKISRSKLKAVSASLGLILVFSLCFLITTAFLLPAQANNTYNMGVGIYRDMSCKESITQIYWNKINPGSNINQTICIKNEGQYSGSLKLITTNWDPLTASNYISLNWNYSGDILAPNEVMPIELTLAVSENSPEIIDFNFNTIITIVQ